MKYYITVEPAGERGSPVWMVYSEQAILDEYWSSWESRGKQYNKANGLPEYQNITAQNCISDWAVIHWAVEATPEALLRIINE